VITQIGIVITQIGPVITGIAPRDRLPTLV
jgi:hypothetical protein